VDETGAMVLCRAAATSIGVLGPCTNALEWTICCADRNSAVFDPDLADVAL
jgi:hypothetical protein